MGLQSLDGLRAWCNPEVAGIKNLKLLFLLAKCFPSTSNIGDVEMLTSRMLRRYMAQNLLMPLTIETLNISGGD